MTTTTNTFVRLEDVLAALKTTTGSDVEPLLAEVERFELVDGYESNEACISEMRDAQGRLLYSDGTRTARRSVAIAIQRSYAHLNG